MFASDAPMTDQTMVVDAVTVDGRHVDPYSEATSRYDNPGRNEIPARLDNDSFVFNYSGRIPDSGAYHQALTEWILPTTSAPANPQRSHRPLRRLRGRRRQPAGRRAQAAQRPQPHLPQLPAQALAASRGAARRGPGPSPTSRRFAGRGMNAASAVRGAERDPDPAARAHDQRAADGDLRGRDPDGAHLGRAFVMARAPDPGDAVPAVAALDPGRARERRGRRRLRRRRRAGRAIDGAELAQAQLRRARAGPAPPASPSARARPPPRARSGGAAPPRPSRGTSPRRGAPEVRIGAHRSAAVPAWRSAGRSPCGARPRSSISRRRAPRTAGAARRAGRRCAPLPGAGGSCGSAPRCTSRATSCQRSAKAAWRARHACARAPPLALGLRAPRPSSRRARLGGEARLTLGGFLREAASSRSALFLRERVRPRARPLLPVRERRRSCASCGAPARAQLAPRAAVSSPRPLALRRLSSSALTLARARARSRAIGSAPRRCSRISSCSRIVRPPRGARDSGASRRFALRAAACCSRRRRSCSSRKRSCSARQAASWRRRLLRLGRLLPPSILCVGGRLAAAVLFVRGGLRAPGLLLGPRLRRRPRARPRHRVGAPRAATTRAASTRSSRAFLSCSARIAASRARSSASTSTRRTSSRNTCAPDASCAAGSAASVSAHRPAGDAPSSTAPRTTLAPASPGGRLAGGQRRRAPRRGGGPRVDLRRPRSPIRPGRLTPALARTGGATAPTSEPIRLACACRSRSSSASRRVR